MDKFFQLVKQNPKKAILVLITLFIFTIGSYFIQGCAFHLSGADNVTGYVKPLELKK